MDPGYYKAFIICGAATLVGTILRYGHRRLIQANYPIQGAIVVFVLGGLVGMTVYPLLKMLGGQWAFWK
ncbi:hypothetical protein HY745_04555 [Candidatus Desantisbacteria bacterium]|nr:hypothetical protein [Candidatus Desantisbacteria bacterium]